MQIFNQYGVLIYVLLHCYHIARNFREWLSAFEGVKIFYTVTKAGLGSFSLTAVQIAA